MRSGLVLFIIKKNENYRTDDFKEVKKDAQTKIEEGIITLFAEPSHTVNQYAKKDEKTPTTPRKVLILRHLWYILKTKQQCTYEQ